MVVEEDLPWSGSGRGPHPRSGSGRGPPTRQGPDQTSWEVLLSKWVACLRKKAFLFFCLLSQPFCSLRESLMHDSLAFWWQEIIVLSGIYSLLEDTAKFMTSWWRIFWHCTRFLGWQNTASAKSHLHNTIINLISEILMCQSHFHLCCVSVCFNIAIDWLKRFYNVAWSTLYWRCYSHITRSQWNVLKITNQQRIVFHCIPISVFSHFHHVRMFFEMCA